MLKPLMRGADNGFGLVSELGGELAVRGHHLAGRENFFTVASRVRGDLGGFFAGAACAFHILANLLAARTRCIKVFLRVPLDLRRAASPGRDLVTELAESVDQFGLIDGGGELLGSEKALRLDGAWLAIVALSHIEDDGVRMELRRDVAIHRAGGIVLELGGDELAVVSAG